MKQQQTQRQSFLPPSKTLCQPPSKQGGFTILELMMTVAIVGIAAMIAMSSMSGLLGATDGENYAKGLSKAINFSRAQSIASGQTVTLCPLVDGKCANVWSNDITIFVDAANNRTLGANTVLRIVEAIPSKDGLAYTGTALGISFYPDGSIGDDDNGVFTYQQNKTCDDNVKGVDVNNSGRARYIKAPGCS